MILLGKSRALVQPRIMSTNPQPDRVSLLIAEEVLRTIYGDDLQGCTVSLEQIANVIDQAVKLSETENRELLQIYEKVIEAVNVLSTPGDPNKVTTSSELQALLSERLDRIQMISRKTMETAALIRKQRGNSSS
jgi:hypothetical protein